MPKIAIIDKNSNVVVNISEDEALPVAVENDTADRTEFLNDHEFVFSETARLGDIWDGENFTTPPIPAPVLTVTEQIATLEATVTPRRIREAVIGIDNGWLAKIEEQIETLRGQL